jgi:hypothetical protein
MMQMKWLKQWKQKFLSWYTGLDNFVSYEDITNQLQENLPWIRALSQNAGGSIQVLYESLDDEGKEDFLQDTARVLGRINRAVRKCQKSDMSAAAILAGLVQITSMYHSSMSQFSTWHEVMQKAQRSTDPAEDAYREQYLKQQATVAPGLPAKAAPPGYS